VELKNTSNSFSLNKSQIKGLQAEQRVRDFFISRKWNIVSERSIVDDTEIDLIVDQHDRKVILEVKYLDNHWRAFERVHTNQIKRLKKVLLSERLRTTYKKIEGYVVFVSSDGSMKFISLDEII
jgi:Holliday junction resolvase-like predicted endonuclease